MKRTPKEKIVHFSKVDSFLARSKSINRIVGVTGFFIGAKIADMIFYR